MRARLYLLHLLQPLRTLLHLLRIEEEAALAVCEHGRRVRAAPYCSCCTCCGYYCCTLLRPLSCARTAARGSPPWGRAPTLRPRGCGGFVGVGKREGKRAR